MKESIIMRFVEEKKHSAKFEPESGQEKPIITGIYLMRVSELIGAQPTKTRRVRVTVEAID